MTTDHMELRLAAARDLPKQMINTMHLIAVLDELDALRAAGQPKRKAAAKKAAADAVVLPPWLPLIEWEGFLAMRVKIKKAATDLAQKAIIKKLERFMQDGMAPADVLMQSVVNSWQDVYALKNMPVRAGEPRRQLPDRRQELDDQKASASAAAKARLLGHRPTPDDGMTFEMERP